MFLIRKSINSGNIVISSNLEAFKNLLGDSGVYFENNSLKSEETFKFGIDIIMRDISKITTLKIETIKKILGKIKPNLVIILKVSVKSSKLRLKKRKSKNRYDNFAQSFYTKAQKSFLKIAKNKKNYFILDSSANDNVLEKNIFNIVKKYLNI